MKTPLSKTEEAVATNLPAMGVKAKIVSIERGKTAADSQYSPPNALQYTVNLEVVEPKKHAGIPLRWWCVIGSEEDPRARQEETWFASRDWAHMKRLLVRSGTAITDDDEEWMEDAVGKTICLHTRLDKNGYARIAMRDSFFREGDEDFLGIGVPVPETTGGKRAEKEKPAPKKPAKTAVEEDDEDEPKRVVPSPKKAKAEPKKAPAPINDADEDDDDADD